MTLFGLHPKSLRGLYCWSRREMAEHVGDLVPYDTLDKYLADENCKRYREPPVVTKVAFYYLYQSLLEAGVEPLNKLEKSQIIEITS